MSSTLLVFLLAGCTKQPTVPQTMLQDVPPETVQRIQPLIDERQELSRQIAAAEVALSRAEREESAEYQRVDAYNRALEADRELKGLAVRRGDTEAARAAEQRILERQMALDQAEATRDAATWNREVAQAELDLLQAQRDLTQAQIEFVQAQAVTDMHDLGLGKFERAVDRATQQRDAAQRRLDQLVSTGPQPAA